MLLLCVVVLLLLLLCCCYVSKKATRRRIKLQQPILFPPTLTLPLPFSTATTASTSTSTSSVYVLRSVLMHQGTAMGGHYRAYTRTSTPTPTPTSTPTLILTSTHTASNRVSKGEEVEVGNGVGAGVEVGIWERQEERESVWLDCNDASVSVAVVRKSTCRLLRTTHCDDQPHPPLHTPYTVPYTHYVHIQ